MPDLVTELKKEHEFIAETLNEIKDLGIISDEGQKTLQAVKNGLLEHLKKEDMRLYPVLNRAAESDVALQRTLDVFAKDMKDITESALEFFGKYAEGGFDFEFAQDFGRLCAALSSRISKEENILYKKYDETMKEV